MAKTSVLLGMLMMTVVVVSSSVPPASMKFFLGDSVFNDIEMFLDPFIPPIVNDLKVPDIDLKANGVLAEIYLNLTNIAPANFQMDNLGFASNAPHSWVFSLNNAGFDLTMDYHVKYGVISVTGSANATVAKTQFNLGFDLDGVGGRLNVSVDDASLTIGSLDIVFHGDDAGLMDLLAKLFSGLLKDELEKKIAGDIAPKLDAFFYKFLSNLPVDLPLYDYGELYFGLVPSNARALVGTEYSMNAFDGSSSPVAYTSFDTVNVYMYHSIDVRSLYAAPSTDTYTFELSFTQRGQVDVAGVSAGSLEMHNPGMCWPEHSQHSTAPVKLVAGESYPLRLRFQSGCGGGHFTLNVCNSKGCHVLSADELSTVSSTTDAPVTAFPTYTEFAFALAMIPQSGPNLDPFPHHQLPSAPVSPSSTTPMFGLALDEFFLNSIGYQVQSTGFLQWNRLHSSITTNTLTFIPQLAQKYPNDTIYTNFSIVGAPSVAFTKGSGLQFQVPTQVNLSVMTHEGIIIDNVLDLDVNFTGSASVDIVKGNNEANLTVKVDTLGLSLALNEHTVNFSVSTYQQFFNAILQGSVVPLINEKLKPIPIPGFLGGVTIEWDDGFVQLSFTFDLFNKVTRHVGVGVPSLQDLPMLYVSSLKHFHEYVFQMLTNL